MCISDFTALDCKGFLIQMEINYRLAFKATWFSGLNLMRISGFWRQFSYSLYFKRVAKRQLFSQDFWSSPAKRLEKKLVKTRPYTHINFVSVDIIQQLSRLRDHEYNFHKSHNFDNYSNDPRMDFISLHHKTSLRKENSSTHLSYAAISWCKWHLFVWRSAIKTDARKTDNNSHDLWW